MSKIELSVLLCRLSKVAEELANETATKSDAVLELDGIINELEQVKQFLPSTIQ